MVYAGILAHGTALSAAETARMIPQVSAPGVRQAMRWAADGSSLIASTQFRLGFLLMVSRYVPFSPSAYHLTSRNFNDFNASNRCCSVRRTNLEKAFNVRTPTRPADGNGRVPFVNHKSLQHRPQVGKRASKLCETLSETLLRRWSSARGTILKRFTVYAVEQRPINWRIPQRQPLCSRRNEILARGH